LTFVGYINKIHHYLVIFQLFIWVIIRSYIVINESRTHCCLLSKQGFYKKNCNCVPKLRNVSVGTLISVEINSGNSLLSKFQVHKCSLCIIKYRYNVKFLIPLMLWAETRVSKLENLKKKILFSPFADIIKKRSLVFPISFL
jgi:hypothetical protein